MKKSVLAKVLSLCLLASLCCAVFFGVACGGSAEPRTLSFVSNGQVYSTVKTAGGEKITLPTEPTMQGYDFGGWFWDKDVWHDEFNENSLLNQRLAKDTNVYAKWTVKGGVPVSEILLNSQSKELEIGETFYLIAEIVPSTASNQNVIWSSSNSNVASVEDGAVTGISLGTATIIAISADGGKVATCRVTVTESVGPTIYVESVSLSMDVLNLNTKSKNVKINATVLPADASNKIVRWTCTNTNVVEISNSGNVTVKGAGSAEIIATTADGEKTDSCTVTVKNVPASYNEASKTELKIYLDASNIYGKYETGGDETYIEEIIEEKFFEDTGEAIDLVINRMTQEDFYGSFKGTVGTADWDAAVSYLGQAGLDDNDAYLQAGIARDLTGMLNAYGYNVKNRVGSFNATTNSAGEIIGVPSVNETKHKGILVRKDYMTAAGYTESKAEAQASGGTLKYVNSIKDFNDMLVKMKENGVEIPLSGFTYDLEFAVLAGAYDCLGYQYDDVVYEADGTTVKSVLPGWVSENYDKVLQQEYDWLTAGLWDGNDANTLSATKREQNFINGKVGVYCVSPNVLNLIDVARKAKEANSSATFAMLDPINAVDSNGNAIEGTGAFVEVSKNSECLIVNKKTTDEKAALVIKYLDWVYSSVDNYELCSYGIKDELWYEEGDGYLTYDDFYSGYSGAFKLLVNDSISNRLNSDLTTEERGWIEKTRNANTIKGETEGMLFYDAPEKVMLNKNFAINSMYPIISGRIWGGVDNPADVYQALCDKFFRHVSGEREGENGWDTNLGVFLETPGDSDYIEWATAQYNKYKQQRG